MNAAIVLFALAAVIEAAMPLSAKTVALTPPAAGTVAIVGRAVCGGSTWLLNVNGELVRIAHGSSRPVIRRVRDLRAGDPFWGLACLADGSLWTLATGHVLARLTPDGAIAERHDMLFPKVALFGIENRLVFLGLPIVANRPVLSASVRGRPDDVRPWIGLPGRSGFGDAPSLVANFVGCGIGLASVLPCWFADDDRVWIGDGTTSRTVPLPSLVGRDIDRAKPIRDIALLPGGWMWVLAAPPSTVDGHRVGARLLLVDERGGARGSLALTTPARLIVSADSRACTLLTAKGHLMVVTRGTP